MPSLLSGSTLRKGGSQTFIKLSEAQPQLPETPSHTTGYTLDTSGKLVTTYRSSLGNIQFTSGTMYSNVPDQNIQIIGTGTSTVIVSGAMANTSTFTGVLIVQGGIGIQDGLWAGKDIHVNGLTIGQGWEGQNNIVIQGDASPQLGEALNGQESIAIGWDTLKGISTSYKSIAMGRYALSSGTGLLQNIAIGDSSLKMIGVYHKLFRANITSVALNPVIITAPNHGVRTGDAIVISDVIGTVELNNNTYYANTLTSDTIALYLDINLNTPELGTMFSSYVNGGTVSLATVYDSNIGIGTDSAKNLVNGQKNFFLGHGLAVNWTTGSYNFIVGHEVANNMTRGNGNIAIVGDNLVDGVDNQISIGSTIYYNGGGYLQLNADTGVGLDTLSTGTGSGALVVYGGVGISDNMFVGGVVNLISTHGSNFQGDGALLVAGGASIAENLRIGQDLFVTRDTTISRELNVTGQGSVNLAPVAADVILSPVLGGKVQITSSVPGSMDSIIIGRTTPEDGYFTNLYVSNIVTATTFYGNLVGVATTATNLQGGDTGSIPYQTTAGNTAFIGIGPMDTVLVSNGTTATWNNIGALSAGQAQTATNAENIFVNAVAPHQSYYIGLTEVINDYSLVDSDSAMTYVTTDTNTSSYFVTGTNLLNVPGSIYSVDGNSDEGNLVYSPKITISNVPPTTSTNRVGDVWVDTDTLAYNQWIYDGTSKFWLQITQL